jgi:pyruvate/2-oxoglutarate dehydrogenase complex dihydrolipoamide acyltransferase (E2) component
MSRIEVKLPHMGVSVEEATIVAWRINPGDKVAADETLCELATDKVETELPAPSAGVLLEIVAPVGTMVPVGETIAILDTGGCEIPSDALTAPDTSAPVGPALPPRHPAISPVARRLAREHGVDLTSLAASGPGGRVAKQDVLRAIQATRPHETGGASLPPGYADVPYELIPTTHVRRRIAENLVRSVQTAAHMTVEVDVVLDVLTEHRASINARRAASGEQKLSLLPFIVRAACSALHDFGDLNATFELERMIRWKQINVSVAVETEAGLAVPVIRCADKLGAPSLATAIARAAEGARRGQLSVEEVSAGTFTVSNLGSAGSVSAPAIIHQPQVAVLGVPAAVRRPWVVQAADGNETIAICSVMALALSYDHRAVDGTYAARFLNAVKDRLESWDETAYS